MQKRGTDAGGHVTIWNEEGLPHACPLIVAKEILRSNPGYTDDAEVALARRTGAKTNTAPEPPRRGRKKKAEPEAAEPEAEPEPKE